MTTYCGLPCPKCSATLRYVSNRKCVACQIRATLHLRIKALRKKLSKTLKEYNDLSKIYLPMDDPNKKMRNVHYD